MGSAADGRASRSEPDRRQLADLSALADGTLDPARRDEVEARIAASPELRVLYERERGVAEALRRAGSVTRAPAAVRARVEAERARRHRVARRPVYAATLAAALAVAIVLMVMLVLPEGTPGAPSVGQAAELGSLGPAAPGPAPDPDAPAVKLGRDVEGTYFPNWSAKFGWRAVGQRVDRINGRLARTVFYEDNGRRIAYTIIAAPALAQPPGPVSSVKGTELRTMTLGGRTVVTWRRAGHTCVLSGVRLAASQLQRLAAWRVPALERA